MQISNLKHIIALAVLVVVLGGMYYAATSFDLFASAKSRAADIEQQTREIEEEILAQLEQIKALRIDGSVYQSEVYQTLQDRSVPLDPPELARENPFAPF